MGLGPPWGATPFLPFLSPHRPRVQTYPPPTSVGPAQLGATNWGGGCRRLLKEEGGPQCSWLSFSLSALGPSGGSQGRVISRSSDKFRGEPSSARPSPQPVFPYSGKVWSCEQEASGGSAPWDGTRCFFCMDCPALSPNQAGPPPRHVPVVALIMLAAPWFCGTSQLVSASWVQLNCWTRESHSGDRLGKSCTLQFRPLKVPGRSGRVGAGGELAPPTPSCSLIPAW